MPGRHRICPSILCRILRSQRTPHRRLRLFPFGLVLSLICVFGKSWHLLRPPDSCAPPHSNSMPLPMLLEVMSSSSSSLSHSKARRETIQSDSFRCEVLCDVARRLDVSCISISNTNPRAYARARSRSRTLISHLQSPSPFRFRFSFAFPFASFRMHLCTFFL